MYPDINRVQPRMPSGQKRRTYGSSAVYISHPTDVTRSTGPMFLAKKFISVFTSDT